VIAAQLKNGKILKINFRHDRLVKEGTIRVGRDAKAHALTHCDIIEGPRQSENVVAAATACCSVNDQFAKETGRRIALQRAIAKFDRETQGALLHAYFSRHEASRKPKQSTNSNEVDTY